MVGTDGRVCDTLGMVKERIVRMQQKYGVTAVYVATDSATAVSHLAAGLPEGLTVLHNVIEKDLAALSPKDFPVYDGDNEDHSMFYELRIAEGDLNRMAYDAVPLEQSVLVLVGDKGAILEQINDLDLPEPVELTVQGEVK